MLGMIFAGAILAAGAPEAVKPAATSPPIKDAPEKVICRSTQLPGSRLMTRTCMTAAAWRDRELEDRNDLNGSQRGPQVMPPR